MASKSGEKKGADGQRLPFEPGASRKKVGKKGGKQDSNAEPKRSKAKASKPKSDTRKKGEEARRQLAGKSSKKSSDKRSRQDSAIPEEVSRRMVRRMAVLCGVPTVLGVSSFVVSYFIVSNEVFELPPIAVLLVSLGFFGVGVLGLSYGALSTSWEVGPNSAGSLLGINEFKVNFGRMRQAWKEAKEAKKAGS
ncbi:MAG: PAM68 family protein [Cyanobacteria bacterium P01_F01_bin.150]